MDGPLPKLCPAVALFHQDGRHSAVALLLKAALIQVSDYMVLGASGFFDDTLASNNILFGVMPCNLSLIFDRQIICKIVKYIDQSDTIS